MLPAGMILLWHGAIADIPSGWLLCDGTLGTPDLKNSFVRGAFDEPSVGVTGGSGLHTHDFTSSGHQHTVPAGSDLLAGAGQSNTTDSQTVTGTTDGAITLPPFYSLAYIMKS